MTKKATSSSSLDEVAPADRVIMASAGQTGHEFACCVTNRDGYRVLAFTDDKRADAIRRALGYVQPNLYQWRRHDLFGKAWCRVELPPDDGPANASGGGNDAR